VGFDVTQASGLADRLDDARGPNGYGEPDADDHIPTLTITTTSLANGQTGVPYSAVLAAAVFRLSGQKIQILKNISVLTAQRVIEPRGDVGLRAVNQKAPLDWRG
jgi:hypothetical protein